MESKFTVVLLVYYPADHQCDQGIKHQQHMEGKRRKLLVDDYKPEIFDKSVDRIEQEQTLIGGRERVDIIEDCAAE